jgi:alpha-D-xyloside xylohydrolase
MVSPILYEAARERKVYLPNGSEWVNAWDGTAHSGGQWISVPAPLETIPVFLRAGSRLMDVFQAVSALSARKS